MITFFVPGPPAGKGRPRFGNGRTFTPPKTVAMEKDVGWYARRAMSGSDLFQGPLRLDVQALYLRPPSWSRKRTDLWKVSRPDLDNIVKLIKDALNGIVWADDAQVAILLASKLYDADLEGVEITVSPITEGTNHAGAVDRK